MNNRMMARKENEIAWNDYSSTMVVDLYSQGYNGIPVDMVSFRNSNLAYYNSGRIKSVLSYSGIRISPDRQYSMQFFHNVNFSAKYKIRVYLLVHPYLKEIVLYEETFEGSTWSNANLSDFSFKVSSDDLGQSYNCSLYIEHSIESVYSWGSNGESARQLIQRNIEVVDDDVGWLVKILNAIKAIPSKISGFFSSLGERIGNFFTDLWENIRQKFDDLKQWFNDLGDRISGFFDDLKLKIETTFQAAVDEIKSWFIPHEGYFDEYKAEWETWAKEHFGVLVQVPDLLIDLFNRLGGLLSYSSYTFTFPEISVPIGDKTYVFVTEQTVDMSYWLNGQSTTRYLYHVYTICVFAVFAFALIKYTDKVYDHMFRVGG